MTTARSVVVSAIAIVAALGFSVGAHADLCMMMLTMASGAGCYSVMLPK